MSTTEAGDSFEAEILQYLQTEIAAGRFFARPDCCTVRSKPKYYSQDRKADIVFDISIELRIPGADTYSLLLLVECKNYRRSISVDQIEEFFAKVQQISPANCKAIFASTTNFQSSAIEYAKSKGIGLLRYFSPDQLDWVLWRSPSSFEFSADAQDQQRIVLGLLQPDFKSRYFDFYFLSPLRATNSSDDFFSDLISTSQIEKGVIRAMRNVADSRIAVVPYLSKGQIEEACLAVLQRIDYRTGAVPLEEICALESRENGLTVEFVLPVGTDGLLAGTLGRIEFNPPKIKIFRQHIASPSRERFTLAHELGHYFLNHARFVARESFNSGDEATFLRVDSGNDIARMEYQANYFAGFLLMPKDPFLKRVSELFDHYDVTDRGFGPLYLDNQPCNQSTFRSVVSGLVSKFSVSRAAAIVRLEGLGLLQDHRPDASTSSLASRLLADGWTQEFR